MYKNTYERQSFWQFLFSFLLIPLVSIPFVGNVLFVKLSKYGRNIKRFAAKYKALELIYTYSRQSAKKRSIFDRIFTHFLLNFKNAKAVRNRLRLVEQELELILSSFDKQEVHLMSLGSGSARAIIETLQRVNGNGKYNTTFVDRSKSALRYSQALAQENGVASSITWVQGMLEEFVKNGRSHPPDVVEMVGIMDYFDDATAKAVIGEIYKLLNPGGILITCNIRKNSEEKFLTKVLEWPMVYREPNDLAEIMELSGFRDYKIIYEPLGIHGLVIAKKPINP